MATSTCQREMGTGDGTQAPILVHQMGKVGSSTIYRNLREQLSAPVFHSHVLNRQRLDVMMEQETDPERRVFRFGAPLKALELLDELRESGVTIRVITGVREPVGRNISAYFENLGDKSAWDVDRLIRDFLDNYHHETPLNWFDLELRDVFGIDVFNRPFETERGWDVVATDDIMLLIIRMENLGAVIRDDVIQDFLGIEALHFDNAFNRGDKKPYAQQYRAFKEQLKLPASYLDNLLSSRYCRHFYSASEIAGLRKVWAIR